MNRHKISAKNASIYIISHYSTISFLLPFYYSEVICVSTGQKTNYLGPKAKKRV